MYNKIVFINLRLFQDNGVYICELPLFELFIAKALETKKVARSIEIYSLYTHEKYADYLEQWEDADIIICWETYTRSQAYVEDYFRLAEFLQANTEAPIVFGGAWTSSYGEFYPEFDVFDAIVKGYAIDSIADLVAAGFRDQFLNTALGESNYDKYDLDTSYLATDPQKHVVMGTLLGYLSSFGCSGGCKFCVNEIHRQLGAGFCARPLERVFEDIRQLVALAPFKNLNFRDDHFFANLERANKIIHFTKAQGKDIACNLTVKVAKADPSFFELVEDWSLDKQLYFGLESMIPEEREILGKPFSDDKLFRFIELAEKYNCVYEGNLIFGFPFHTPESILDQCRKILPLVREYPGLLIRSNAYIPKHGTSIQQMSFPDIHKKINFHQLSLLYQARVEDFQSLMYGDKFDDINIEGLSRAFLSIIAIKRLRQHFPSFLQWMLGLGFGAMESNILNGAANGMVSRTLTLPRITQTRRRLTRICLQYHKLADRLRIANPDVSLDN